ncbi:hypothetical protein C2G38_2217946 [Gigaspora rosea]|uniref:Uncharacterized protein n=1 Tax=Gigaspora rosea TaxID=44941 RepID=A0A397UAN3_9GLOM|nr:hypothetical protein C2G38_2217946 [Gigaspora rosea]
MDSNTNTKISQNQSPVTLPTKDSYQGFKFARQIYQVSLVSSMSSTSITQEAFTLTPQSANSHGFQGSKIPLQELPPIPNQNHEMQEFLQRNMFMNSNITFHVHNHYYTTLQQ